MTKIKYLHTDTIFISGLENHIFKILDDLQTKDHEISTLRQKIAEVLAVMPGHSSSGMNASIDEPTIGAGHGSNGTINGGGLTLSGFSSNLAPTTLALDLPQDTDLSSFTGSNKLSALGLANLKDKLLTSDTSCLSGNNSLYTTAFSRTNGNTDH